MSRYKHPASEFEKMQKHLSVMLVWIVAENARYTQINCIPTVFQQCHPERMPPKLLMQPTSGLCDVMAMGEIGLSLIS